MLAPFFKAFLSGWGAFQSKETRLCEENENTFTLNIYYIHPCSCFQFTVNEIARNKTINGPRRLTAVESSCRCYSRGFFPFSLRFCLSYWRLSRANNPASRARIIPPVTQATEFVELPKLLGTELEDSSLCTLPAFHWPCYSRWRLNEQRMK